MRHGRHIRRPCVLSRLIQIKAVPVEINSGKKKADCVMNNMTKRAYVEAIDGEMAVLNIKRECTCQNKYACDAKCFSVSLQDEIIKTSVKNNIGAKAGDLVEVETKTSSILIYTSVVFLLPLIVGLSAYFVTSEFISGEIMPYVISVISFAASILFSYYFLDKIVKSKENFVIGKILS